jgi:aspartokinase
MENVAGVSAKAFRKLADAGVNIDLLLPVRVSAEEFLAVVCAENLEAAASALGDQVVGD